MSLASIRFRFFSIKTSFSIPAPATLSAFCVLLLSTIIVQSPAQGLRAGAAKRIVTPDPLLPVSGGIGPGQPSTEKRGELWTRVLVLEKEGVRVAIVGSDFLGFPAALGDKVRAAVKGIPPENILISATHTHSGPDCYGFPDANGAVGGDLAYLTSVCEKMADAINTATAELKPARLRIGTDEAIGKIAYNYYAPELYDPRCSVIQVLDEGDKAIGTLVNYAIHPEVLGSGQGITSADVIGPLYDRVEQEAGGIAVFVNSALGGMVTADCRGPDGKDIQTWEECQRIGNLLADEALRIISAAPVQESPVLRCHAKQVSFPVESAMMRMIIERSPLGYELAADGTISTQLNLIELGNSRIATIPGEALPNIGYYLKRQMGAEHNLLFGLTNDAFGYILSEVDWDSFKRYRYITRTSLGERTGTILIESVMDLVKSATVH